MNWLRAKTNCLLKDYTFSTLLCSLGKVWIYAHISLLCYTTLSLLYFALWGRFGFMRTFLYFAIFVLCFLRDCQFNPKEKRSTMRCNSWLVEVAENVNSFNSWQTIILQPLEALEALATFDLKQTCSYSKLCHCCFCYSAYFCSLLPSTLLHLHWIN